MQEFTHDGLTFDVRDTGPADGEVVVLLHGFPEDGGAYNRVAPGLHEAGYRTLVPDQRGYSPGAQPRGRSPYRVANLVGDVVALLDHAGVARAHLVGHDWGAWVAWEVARWQPGRLLTLTALSVPHPQAMVWSWWHSRQALRSSYMLWFQLPWVVERTTATRLRSILLAAGLNPNDAAAYGRRFATPSSLTGPLAWYRALPFTFLDGVGHRPAAPVSVPSTYIWGNRDAYVDRAAAEQAGRYVRADYRFIELDADHWLPENYAAELTPVILERLRTSPLTP